MSNDDAGQWMRDMAFLRFGPDTETAARQLYPGTGPRITHPEGCRCQPCSELRRATGRGRRMDKHIADLMSVKDRGRTPAGQEAVNRSRREEADERAAAVRELADAGTYPYRAGRETAQEFLDSAKPAAVSRFRRCPAGCSLPYCSHFKALDEGTAMAREQLAKTDWGSWHEPGCGCGCEKPGRASEIPEAVTSDCTCRGPAWKAYSPYWAAHKDGCPMRARLCAQAAPGDLDQVYRAAEARGADPVAQWQEVTRSIVLPDYGQIVTAVPDQPPGTCPKCRTGPLFKGNRCWYCWTLEALPAAPEIAKPVRGHALLKVNATVAVAMLGCLLMIAALAGYPGLLFPGLILMIAGTRGALKW